MNDNQYTNNHIKQALLQLYPQKMLNGHQLRHLMTLALMISGIVQGKSCRFVDIAEKISTATTSESQQKKFSRLCKHKVVDHETYFLPFIQLLLQNATKNGKVMLAMDASTTGRKCVTLMVSLIYQNRAIPLVWITVKGKKGHLPEETHLKLLEMVQKIIPENTEVVFLGDGEFDGIQLQQAVLEAQWNYVCRTAKNCIVTDGDERFKLSDMDVAPNDIHEILGVQMTAKKFGPVNLIVWWDEGHDEPIYLVTSLSCTVDAYELYRKRFLIETFFSDQKSRGFNLQKSHLSHPDRVSTLLIASCLAYIWIIYLGCIAKEDKQIMRQIHRTDRCDLSLFKIGLRYLAYLISKVPPLKVVALMVT